MRYLKEGKWEDFKSKVDLIDKTKLEIIEEYLLEIKNCMVDLEDYEKDSKSELDYPSFECWYEYIIKANNINALANLVGKLDDYIGDDSWDLSWKMKGGTSYGWSLETLVKELDKNEYLGDIRVFFTFDDLN